jgi:hypothetical protein
MEPVYSCGDILFLCYLPDDKKWKDQKIKYQLISNIAPGIFLPQRSQRISQRNTKVRIIL